MDYMRAAYIVDAARTAVGSFGGSLSTLGPVKIAADVLLSLFDRTNIEPADIDEVVLGCVLPAGYGQNIAREAAVTAGIPVDRTAMTINMVCGSGLRSVIQATRTIAARDAECIVAGGTECMSTAPYLLPSARYGYRMGNGDVIDYMVHDGLRDTFNDYHMGVTAENVAAKYGISREEQDAFAAGSQKKAEAAITSGRFIDEIVAVSIPRRKGDPVVFDTDEFPRFGTTVEILSNLKPAFDENGTVTAGNSSGINDGAAGLLVASEDFLNDQDVKPLARIVSYGYHGTDPALMGIGPVKAVRIALERAGWSMRDLELIEANEAFAAQAIAVNRDLGWDTDIVNVNGGAIALGHPIGASGARILVTLAHEMKKRKLNKGLATLCVGGGMGVAICIEAAW